jgi:hypothetical protein
MTMMISTPTAGETIMTDPTKFTVPTEGRDDLAKLAVTLFFEDVKYSEFAALPKDDQLAIAENAKIGIDGLIRALGYAAEYQTAHGDALRRYAAERSHREHRDRQSMLRELRQLE